MKPNITKTQRRNLRKLANGLLNLPRGYKHFDMSDYLSSDQFVGDDSPSSANDVLGHCGTSACAAGHGPVMGIRARKKEYWGDYVNRVFVRENGKEYDWCFEAMWDVIDNTPHGAALRILYMLDYGLPDNFDFLGICEGGNDFVSLYTNAYDIVEVAA